MCIRDRDRTNLEAEGDRVVRSAQQVTEDATQSTAVRLGRGRDSKAVLAHAEHPGAGVDHSVERHAECQVARWRDRAQKVDRVDGEDDAGAKAADARLWVKAPRPGCDVVDAVGDRQGADARDVKRERAAVERQVLSLIHI